MIGPSLLKPKCRDLYATSTNEMCCLKCKVLHKYDISMKTVLTALMQLVKIILNSDSSTQQENPVGHTS